MLEHKHLILKGKMSKVVDVNTVDEWLKALVFLLDMELIKEFPNNPSVAYIDGENGGVTGCALITTSHIVLHTWNNSLDFQLDVYSCKEYNPEEVIIHCTKLGFDIEAKKFFDRKYDIIDENI
jgi:S-adenosylmethionine/arginine decarboxylase-like enzyme